MVNNPGRPVLDVSWAQFNNAVEDLYFKIRENKDLKYIYGLPRGGLPLAVALSHKLNLELITESTTLKLYKPEQLLVVDDISDSGNTLVKFLEGFGEVETATIFKRSQTKYKPTYIVQVLSKEWIKFPWESK